ncbi:MAG: putative metal-binding motif-containing protein, partial [Deltaproteobacteria bacterium]|nr:putative metal-binding motif-containing protein [Deltaproteobacteria bacterium]
MRLFVSLSILAIIGCTWGIIPEEPSEKDTSENNGGGGGSGNDRDGDGTADALDCDPDDPNANPEAKEVCNGFDDDCDGETDEGFDTTWYRDADNDGYGAGQPKTSCEKPEGYVEQDGDCDDGDKK